MVNLTIDGKTVQVPEGTTVLQAAEAAGIQVPTLCHHPALKPFGGCRLCLVEVEGARTLQPSCTLPASENMVVLTQTEKVNKARKFVLTLIFSDRNHFCPFCQVTGGDCELQNAALDQGMSHWPYQPTWAHFAVDSSHPYFILDQNRCIVCHRCVRACGQLVGNYTLGIEERGASSMVVADTGSLLGESTCVQCGTCVAVCPTGALIDRHSAYQGLEKDIDVTQSVCVGCSVGCGITVSTRDNRLVRIVGDWDAPVNGGVLCKEGRFIPLDEDRERITTPMIKKDGKLQPATWEEALAVASDRLKPLAGMNGNGVAAVASTRLPVEALSMFKQVFADGLSGKMVTSMEEGVSTAAAANLSAELGSAFETGLKAVEEADCVLTIGVNLAESHMVAGFLVKRNLPNGTRLIVVDSDENKLSPLAGVVLTPTAGTEAEIFKGIRAGLVKLGLREGDMFAAEGELVRAAQAAGVTEVELLNAAGSIGLSEKPVIIYGKGITGQESDQALRQMVAFGQENGVGLVGMKGKANSLAAAIYQLDKPFEINAHQGAYVALGDDTPSQRLTQKLEKAPFLAVQASYVSRLTAMADVVLPVQTWAEQEGHYVNLEGRVQKANRALTPAQDMPSNAQVLQALAEQMGLVTDPNWQSTLCAGPTPVAVVM